ncbi:hypothetical protein A2Z00_01630 [Candidatus Gottesmanbacteria bacterium RBG_13_45_10]|uniref:EamA domain-containing protein n=1 Tax=Candidatus Gottesmanbacteria bacterium RBG_13_45_10 TaxID=1798370 RepID=A0A1F5ZHR5_9BACT|nr:MAG: hypothetical protein A2Z00_01630 [Candidatus Gottesmanbacteria bacterium RBG_13_45_10]
MNKKVGFYSLLLSGLIFGTFPMLIRFITSSFGTFTQISLRTAIAAVIVGAILFRNKTSLNVRHIHPIALLLFFLAFPLDVIFYTFAIVTGKATNALFLLFAVSLLFSLITGTLFFKEKISYQKIIAVVLLLIGLVCFTHPFDSLGLTMATIFGLLAGFFDALTNLLRKHIGVADRWVTLFYQYLTMGVLTFLLGNFSGEIMIKNISIIPIAIIVIYGILNVSTGSLLAIGFSNFDFNLGTVVLASELFFGAIFNTIFLHEVPTTIEAVGGLIIFAAVLAANLTFAPRESRA